MSRFMDARSGLSAPGKRRASHLPGALVAVPCIISVLLGSRSAGALPWDAVSLSAHGMYGVHLDGETLDNPYGVGLDVQAGITLPVSIYAGVSLSHFFGEEASYTLTSDPGIAVEHRAAFTQVLAHLGYDWPLDGVLLRPNLGIGYGHARDVAPMTRPGVGSICRADERLSAEARPTSPAALGSGKL